MTVRQRELKEIREDVNQLLAKIIGEDNVALAEELDKEVRNQPNINCLQGELIQGVDIAKAINEYFESKLKNM